MDELTSSEPGELQVLIAKFHSQFIWGFHEKLKMPLARSLVGGTAGLVFMGAIFGLSGFNFQFKVLS